MDEMVAGHVPPERRDGASDRVRMSANALAAYFDCTRQNIARLVAEGVLERGGRMDFTIEIDAGWRICGIYVRRCGVAAFAAFGRGDKGGGTESQEVAV